MRVLCGIIDNDVNNSNQIMRKSSSTQLFPIDFNPKEFRVGESSIDKLPLKRRYSAAQIQVMPKQNRGSELDLLRKKNEVLTRENEQLRREIEGYKLQSTVGTVCKTEAKVSNYKDIIREKLSSKARQSQNTECETRLLSSKEVSLEQSSLTISDYHRQYKISQKIPALADLRDAADRFFREYCDSYTKLKTLFECLQCSKQLQSYKKLQNVIELYKVPILYQKTPQALLRDISKSKERVKTKGRDEQAKIRKQKDEQCPQQFSPYETMARIEMWLSKACGSSRVMRGLRESAVVKKFMLKMYQK